MISRKEKHRKKRYPSIIKLLMGFVTAIVLIGSSVTVSYADQSIESLLTNWFSTQKENSIDEIQQAIDKERVKQTTRLEKQLQQKIQQAEKNLEKFTEKEKKKRVTELQHYADQLINQMKIDESSQKKKIQQKLNEIVKEAKNTMQTVNTQDSTT
ncbi:hypothetical protein [Virgibacillus siamensis]|uniref:hypothetical protein n=1 Tax=Virgibacillus siamensis TaxID=480071 RepID=UPI000987A6D4|nr:hypothetical protein [Virgibacillus siamensis]